MNRNLIMKMYKYILVLFSLLCAQVSVFALDENCVVHLDKSFYVVGENIQFNLFLPLEFKDHNVAIKAVILDSDGHVKDSFFKKTNSNTQVSGAYKIPYQFKPDMYYIQFMSVNSIEKEELVYAEAAIPIYNFLEDIVPANATKLQDIEPRDMLVSKQLSLEVNIPDQINSRDNVISNIRVTDSNGSPVNSNISISVINEDIAGQSVLGAPNIIQGNALPENVAPKLEQDIYLKGILKDAEGLHIKANIVGAYSSLENKFLFTRSDENGVFFLNLPEFEGNKPVQIVGYHVDHENIQLDRDLRYSIQNPQAFYFNDKVKEYLELSRIRKKIEQHHELIENESNKELNTLQVSELKPDASYNIREYEAFENMASFFKEILTPLRFREKKDQFEAYMYDPTERRASKKYFQGKPMFIINGMVTRDGNYIANLPMSKIERVDLFFSPKQLRDQFNAFGRFGMVRISTSDPNLQVPQAEIEDVVMIYGVNPSEGKSSIKNLPDGYPLFDPQVYWSGNKQTDGNGSIDIEYIQPDDEGSYSITIVARDDKGNVGTKTMSYIIEN